MKWYETLENNKFLCMLYRQVPDLSDVEISAINVTHDGPTLNVGLDLPKYADFPPKKWHNEFNTIGLSLEFFEFDALEWRGWDTTNIATIEIEPYQGRYRVKILSNKIELKFLASFISVKNISGYCREDRR